MVYFNNFDEIFKLLGKHKLPELFTEEIDKMKNPIHIKEKQFMIKSLYTQEARPDGFICELYQVFRKTKY